LSWEKKRKYGVGHEVSAEGGCICIVQSPFSSVYLFILLFIIIVEPNLLLNTRQYTWVGLEFLYEHLVVRLHNVINQKTGVYRNIW